MLPEDLPCRRNGRGPLRFRRIWEALERGLSHPLRQALGLVVSINYLHTLVVREAVPPIGDHAACHDF